MIAGFKIRDRYTGLFKLNNLKWTKRGNTWPTLTQLKNNIKKLYKKNLIKTIPVNWEIVVAYTLPHTTLPVSGLINLKEKEVITMALAQYKEK
jgi:hypothetical protein